MPASGRYRSRFGSLWAMASFLPKTNSATSAAVFRAARCLAVGGYPGIAKRSRGSTCVRFAETGDTARCLETSGESSDRDFILSFLHKFKAVSYLELLAVPHGCFFGGDLFFFVGILVLSAGSPRV